MPQDLTSQQLIDILESIDDGILVLDHKQVVTYCNHSIEKMTGWEKPDIIGSPVFTKIKLLRKRDRVENNDYVGKMLSSGLKNIPKSDRLLISKTGSEITVRVAALPLLSPDRHLEGGVIILYDRSAEIEKLMLRSDFSYFQHQIGSPLSGALWNMDMAISEAHSDEEKAKLRRIKNSMESIRVMTVKMLLASRLGQGLINPKFQTIDLMDTLAPLIEEEKSKNQEAGMTLNVLEPDRKISLSTDPEFLKGILREILENARLYSHPNSTINFSISPKNNGVLFEVKDTGLGIPENEVSTVFTKFYRGVNIKEIPGAGLGLHIALQYAKLIKAQIWFASKENQGSTFSVFLPTS